MSERKCSLPLFTNNSCQRLDSEEINEGLYLLTKESNHELTTRNSVNRGCVRYILLLLFCLIKFGPFYTASTPSALQTEIMQTMSMDNTQFAALYSIYLWPNIFLAPIGGYLTDRFFGLRLAGIVYASLMLCGHLLFSLGTWMDNFRFMLFGRFIYGLPFHSLLAVQQSFVTKWFHGKELHFAFGVLVSVARLGTGLNFLVTHHIYVYFETIASGTTCLALVMTTAGLSAILSLLAVILASLIDLRAEKQCGQSGRFLLVEEAESKTIKMTNFFHLDGFPLAYWLTVLVMVTFYIAMNPFIALSTSFFRKKYEFTQEEADHLNGIVFILAAFAAPLLGFTIDKTGNKLVWVLTAALLGFTAHALFSITQLTPWVPMATLTIGVSLMASSLWPIIPKVVPPSKLTTAYGVTLSAQVAGTTLAPLISGYLIENFGYIYFELAFVLYLGTCISLIAILSVLNEVKSYGIN